MNVFKELVNCIYKESLTPPQDPAAAPRTPNDQVGGLADLADGVQAHLTAGSVNGGECGRCKTDSP